MKIPDGDGPSRTCIATRKALPVEALIRFVAGPDGVLVPDLRRKLPGRGVWVTAEAGAVAEAVRRKAFARALKGPVTLPDDLPGLVGGLLRRDALQALSMANKAGGVIAGAVKIEAAAGRGFVALLHAAEAAPGGVEKIERAVRSRQRDGLAIPAIRLFTCEELSLSLGREHVIHAALVTGAASGSALKKARAADHYWRGTADPTLPSGLPGQEGVGTCISTEDSDPDE